MRYPSGIVDVEWDVISPLLPKAKGRRPRTTSLREVVNTIFYVNRSGGAWSMLPKDFPPYQTVCRYFRAWSKEATWEKVHEAG